MRGLVSKMLDLSGPKRVPLLIINSTGKINAHGNEKRTTTVLFQRPRRRRRMRRHRFFFGSECYKFVGKPIFPDTL